MNRFCHLALATVLASVVPHAADAASFRQIASTSDGDGYYLDPSSERHIRGFVRMDLFERKHFSELVISLKKTLEFDCSGRRSREIKSVQYDMAGKQIGESIEFHGFSNDVPDSEKLVMEQVRGDHALPEQLEGMALDFACGSEEYRERHPYVGDLP